MRVFRGRAVTATTVPAGRRTTHDAGATRTRPIAPEPVRRRPVLRPAVPAAA